MKRILALVLMAALATLVAGCDESAGSSSGNPFLDDMDNFGKADSHYFNPDGIEVEVDIEGDIEASSWSIWDGPAMLGQFALTYLRTNGNFYLESLAEDASSDQRVEWLVDGTWFSAADARNLDTAKLKHFRIRGINAVLLHGAREGAVEGKVYKVPVPLKPDSIMADAGKTCATEDAHMGLSQSIYWYLWNPDKSTCKVAKQDLSLTISKMMPTAKVVYPEYDRLVADGKITTVVLFGQIGDGAISDSDIGMRGFVQMAGWLKQAAFKEIAPVPAGRRFSKTINGIAFEIDLYSPRDFSGLDDYAHEDNFNRAITEHEIVVYDGHSMLGASDYWTRPKYPEFYQIFLYGGCLGYEYYVKAILNGKGGSWDNLDILSSVIEVSAGANEFAAPALAKMMWALEHNYNASWKDLLGAVRKAVGDSTFGVSGVRENCFSPSGSLCGANPPAEGETKRFDDKEKTSIPDASKTGIVRVLDVPDSIIPASVALELKVTHSYVGDLRIVIEHDGIEKTVWNQEGSSGSGIDETFTLEDFAGAEAKGRWTLIVVDDASADTGSLDSWSLVFTVPSN